jgi:pyruvate/2-oxoglutarate dehydrogenase complex dihydrolipoamide acyltransferase (E2) component
MSQPRGFTLPLSLPRRIVGDLMHFVKKVPTVPVERCMNLAEVAAARGRAAPKPSWCAIFTKAWAMACAAHPPLRRIYFGFPYERLYQHPIPVASVAVERPYGDDNGVFFTQITSPEQHALTDLDQRLKWFKDRPLGSSAIMRRQLLIARMPRPIRRMLWWLGLNLYGRLRVRMYGTFGVSVYSGLGATSLHPPTVGTSTITYGVIDAAGDVAVRVAYDHRALDGADVARALDSLERFLKHEILAELRYLECVDPEAREVA